jgi:hypothetical protein
MAKPPVPGSMDVQTAAPEPGKKPGTAITSPPLNIVKFRDDRMRGLTVRVARLWPSRPGG